MASRGFHVLGQAWLLGDDLWGGLVVCLVCSPASQERPPESSAQADFKSDEAERGHVLGHGLGRSGGLVFWEGTLPGFPGNKNKKQNKQTADQVLEKPIQNAKASLCLPFSLKKYLRSGTAPWPTSPCWHLAGRSELAAGHE